MAFDDYQQERDFYRAWSAVEIARPVNYSLFTFGESVLPYFLVCGDSQMRSQVSITQGQVRIKRPLIITPQNMRPEFRNFFENEREEGMVEFLLTRTAHFSNLQFDNHSGYRKIVSDNMEEAVARLNRELDEQEEDQVAILTAPPELAGIALVRYAAERVWQSAPDNIQELRERGFLP